MTGQPISDPAEPRAGGVWTLSGGRPIIAEPDGPATLLVPSESVLLLVVDLPLGTHAKRVAALPFAIEDRIADPIDAVHIALGSEIAPKRYLVAVVRHARMREWVEIAEAEGLAHAAMVPDALALPVPDEGWTAEAGDGRVLVRSGDGTGFAISSALVGQAWEAAGRPRIWNAGSVPVGELPQEPRPAGGGGLAERLARPAVDLRQGVYARRAAGGSGWLKRLGWIAAAGIAAHTMIAAADAVMLRVIAERRADDTRAVVAQAAPGANLGEDLQASVTDMLPPPGVAGSRFVPLVTRTSNALAPLSSAVTARSMRFEGNALVMEIEPGEPGLAGRIRDAMRAAGVSADVAAGADGAVRLTVRA
ncbi:type II secretion system protein GspL [Sphingomonas sp. BT-65]|uniref:type II secretion system protein GspL n=1 Tax=Sphingomonas sp. BT-65 TaxID=2989821 RepID=UPI0022361C9B|nr:type II secretion system protein GspL [Sphingomonas sp. BT-65]MCW4460107.1 type II secretion system protein GspL [Sphingomonas sp. BT-65]